MNWEVKCRTREREQKAFWRYMRSRRFRGERPPPSIGSRHLHVTKSPLERGRSPRPAPPTVLSPCILGRGRARTLEGVMNGKFAAFEHKLRGARQVKGTEEDYGKPPLVVNASVETLSWCCSHYFRPTYYSVPQQKYLIDF